MTEDNNIIDIRNLSKFYMQAGTSFSILEDINFNLQAGEAMALVGPSGSGKSTLLNIIGMLDVPSSGEIHIKGIEVSKLSDEEQTSLRGKNIGFVFQFHHLFQDFSALENVMLPLRIQGFSIRDAKQKSEEVLEKIGLNDRMSNFPSQLSGGEQQRVSIARSLVLKPSLLIADEPTGNLDAQTAQSAFNMMMELVSIFNTSIVVATHDMDIANQMPRRITIKDKKIIEI